MATQFISKMVSAYAVVQVQHAGVDSGRTAGVGVRVDEDPAMAILVGKVGGRFANVKRCPFPA
eukprot:1862498-Lingulodinium_polyedra.AAC.1